MLTKKSKRRVLGNTTISVTIDLDEIVDELSDEDVLEICEHKGIELEMKFESIRDEDLYNAFLEAKEKFSYEELMKRLS